MKNKIEKTILLNSVETYFNDLNGREKEIIILYCEDNKSLFGLVDPWNGTIIDEIEFKGSLSGDELKLDLQTFFKENGCKVWTDTEGTLF